MKKYILLPLAISILGCTSQKPVYYEANAGSAPTTAPATAPQVKPDNTVYYVWENGNFIQSELDKKPVPIGGTESFSRTLGKQISYPAEARNRGIAGTVILNVVVNEAGRAETVQVKKGIGYGCDEVAANAWKKAAENGFEPALKSGKAVKVQYDVPVNFKFR